MLQRQSNWWPLLVTLAFVIAAAAALLMTQVAGSVALCWPANALAAALMIRIPGARKVSTLAGVFAASVLCNLCFGQPHWQTAALFSLVNVTEVSLAVFTFRRLWPLPFPHLTIEQAALATVVCAMVVPGCGALAAGLIVHGLPGGQVSTALFQWWSSDSLGTCLVAPPLLLGSVQGVRQLLQRRFLPGNSLSVVLSLAGTFIAIRYVHFTFVTISVVLVVSAVRMGGFGASLLSMGSGITVVVLWALDIRPQGLEASAISPALMGLPVAALLATMLPPIAVGLTTDSRRRVARALRQGERHFRESLDRSPLGVVLISLDGKWTYTNFAMQAMLGYSAGEFLEFPPGGPSHPEDAAAAQARFDRLKRREMSGYEIERRLQHKSGSWVWVRAVVSMVCDEAGEPLHYIGQLENIAERRLAEAKLAQERERFRTTLRAIDDAVITTDAQGYISYANPAATELLGVPQEVLQGRALEELLCLTDTESGTLNNDLNALSLLEGKVFRREGISLLHRADGTLCYVSEVVSPIFDEQRRTTGAVVVLRDESVEFGRARELQHTATHDRLTGLLNRPEFERRLTQALRGAATSQAALLAIDLDRFKAVNDAGGHAAGDAMLQKVAQVLRGKVRAADAIARWGGDEFLVLLGDCPSERALTLGEELLGALNPLSLAWEGATYSIGASAGIALRDPACASPADWLAAADKACYLAKASGRGCVRSATQAVPVSQAG